MYRRRKKRPNYGTRSVEVIRGPNGFGFTISGQQPCILSNIVPNSPAYISGLRAGDFLISVNGINVANLFHDSIVNLIGNSMGSVRLMIAETFYEDSSEDESVQKVVRSRLKNPHNKSKSNRSIEDKVPIGLHRSCEAMDVDEVPPNFSVMPEIQNSQMENDNLNKSIHMDEGSSLEYQAIVGYLGTIEMPKQIATSSKLQTIRMCIKKMRQEKRNPMIVLMKIMPSCLTLQNDTNTVLAYYSAMRINYVNNTQEKDSKYFGLVTTAVHVNGELYDGIINLDNSQEDVIVSNSCHVFMVDPNQIDHSIHASLASKFHLTCTRDDIGNSCLEFPKNSEFLISLICSMYNLKIQSNRDCGILSDSNAGPSNIIKNRPKDLKNSDNVIANSPQPSNHSEITTASSNSDSGIGFHNDVTNISDRILIVDFPPNRKSTCMGNTSHNRSQSLDEASTSGLSHSKRNVINNARLTVRVMPDPKIMVKDIDIDDSADHYETLYPLSSSKSAINETVSSYKNQSFVFRSYDDISRINKDKYSTELLNPTSMSIDDITLLGEAPKPPLEEHVFVQPVKPVKKSRRSLFNFKSSSKSNVSVDNSSANTNSTTVTPDKFSPQVFGVRSPLSASVENISTNCSKRWSTTKSDSDSIWGSLRDIRHSLLTDKTHMNLMDGIQSEPDLRVNDDLSELTNEVSNSNVSPFRRWGQSSFRTQPTEQRPQIPRRPSSLTAASENDVYSKSVNDIGSQLNETNKINKYVLSEGQLMSPQLKHSRASNAIVDANTGVQAWSTAFEKLVEDPIGLHAFAEFLKKEFSAENIYFWTACQRYRLMTSDTRKKEALDIFNKHLASGASEPVNVDSQARNVTQENLDKAPEDLFLLAQKQIFNLMKFDSYQRFIRSDLYKKCLDAEKKNQPMPYPIDQLDKMLSITLNTLPSPISSSKLKKSLSNAEDRRRKSLLPWHRKTRCKSRDRTTDDENGNTLNKNNGNGNTLKSSTTSINDVHSSRSSLSSFDAVVSDENKSTLCRVILPDGATTILQTKLTENIRGLIQRLLDKRGLDFKAFEVYLVSNVSGVPGLNRPLDLDAVSTTIAGREINVEQRVVFRLDLPNRKVISVKSKPCKVMFEVLRPILHKYNYRLDAVNVSLACRHNDSKTPAELLQEPIKLDIPVTTADGQRLKITYKNSTAVTGLPKIQYSIDSDSNNKTMGYNLRSNKRVLHTNTLNEITNKVFNELLQSKVDSFTPSSKQLAVPIRIRKASEEESSIRSGEIDSEADSSSRGNQNRLKRHNSSHMGSSFSGVSTKSTVTDDRIDDQKKSVIAKLSSGARLQATTRTDNLEVLEEGINRAQKARLEDQRGTEINFELPEFLKNQQLVSSSISDDNKTKPTPAPRLSLVSQRSVQKTSPVKSPDVIDFSISDKNFSLNDNVNSREPPPLPPKPKLRPSSTWATSPTKPSIGSPRELVLGDEKSNSKKLFDSSSTSFV